MKNVAPPVNAMGKRMFIIRRSVLYLALGMPLFLSMFCSAPRAQDFVVEYYAEHYKENQNGNKDQSRIYHTLQVKTEFGFKLLLLKGTDETYRNWLREYLATQKTLILKVPEEEVALFRSSEAFTIDFTRIHPVIAEKWRFTKEAKPAPPKDFPEDKQQILVVDDNPKQLALIREMLTHLGYLVTERSSTNAALRLFKAQPNMFKLLLTGYDEPEMTGSELAQKILEIRPELPVMIYTEQDRVITDDMRPKAALYKDNFLIKPVVFRDFSKHIRHLLGTPEAPQQPPAKEEGTGAPPPRSRDNEPHHQLGFDMLTPTHLILSDLLWCFSRPSRGRHPPGLSLG